MVLALCIVRFVWLALCAVGALCSWQLVWLALCTFGTVCGWCFVSPVLCAASAFCGQVCLCTGCTLLLDMLKYYVTLCSGWHCALGMLVHWHMQLSSGKVLALCVYICMALCQP